MYNDRVCVVGTFASRSLVPLVSVDLLQYLLFLLFNINGFLFLVVSNKL